MRLRLELLDGRQAGAARISDLSAPFSVGTRADATWPLRSDQGAEGQAVLHREAGGVMLTGSGDVTVEGRPALGRPVAVGHGSVIAVAGRQLRLHVETGPDRGIAIEAPSISAILSDVAPGGVTASGPLPGQDGPSPLDQPALPRPNADRYWQEPRAFADAESGAQGAVLPVDWDADVAPLSDRTAQGRATLGRTNVNPVTGPILTGPALQPADRPDLRDPQTAEAALAQALDALTQIEAGLQDALAQLGVASPAPGIVSHSLTPAAFLADPDGHARAALALRAQAIGGMQQALLDACRKTIAQAAARLDPDQIAAQPGSGLVARLVPATVHWAEYRNRFAPAQGVPPLSERAFAEQIRAALGRSDQTKDE